MLDAYTVRKAIPRVVIAVIGINLSIYLCIALIDITMIAGRGINNLLVGPFVDKSLVASTLNVSEPSVGNNILGFLAVGGLLAGILGTIFLGIGAAASFALSILGLLLPLIVMIAFIALAVLFTLIIRQALLVFLTVVSPIAIALYILPGTEKYFKQWFDLFVKTLLVYPIIAIIFAMSNVMASILLTSSSGAVILSPASIMQSSHIFAASFPTEILRLLAAIIVLYAPLFMIPFAFKIAGGAMAAVMNVANAQANKYGDRWGKRMRQRRQDPNTFFGRRKAIAERNRLQRRADYADALKRRASSDGRSATSRALFRAAAGVVGGTNVEALSSAKRAEVSKEVNDQINTGRDEEIRGLTVDISRGFNTLQSEGRARVHEGRRQYQSLGGAWIDEAHVMAGHNRWGRDSYAQQAALSYEMRKASTDEQVHNISQNYGSLATNSWGMSEGMARGAFTGAGFENQNQHLEFKHTDAMTGELNYDNFVQEAYEKKGNYPLSQMSAHTAKQLMNAWNDPNASNERREQIRAVSETFMNRGLGGGQISGMEGDIPIQSPPTQQPIATAQQDSGELPAGTILGPRGETLRSPAAAGQPAASFHGSGAGHTNEAFRELAQLTGVYRDGGPTNPYGNPADPGNSNPGARQS